MFINQKVLIMKEIWVPVKGYIGLYEVSNLGRVRSLNYNHSRKTKLLKQRKTKFGYMRVGLFKNYKQKTFFVHRLVAEAFIPNWFNYQQVNHIDEDKTNNHVDNLEWCTAGYNTNYGTRNEKVSVKMTNGKLSKGVLQFTLDGEFVREWSSTREAERNGYNHGDIGLCCRGVYKQYKGFVWKYKEVS